jgi:apolipoprotein D and lipocalin family protein
MKSTLIILISIFFTACSAPKAALKTVEKVNINKYIGTWYEIARYEHFFEVGCLDVSATYTLRENGEIDVLNRCTKEGELSEAKGRAYATDATNSKLKVSFFWPFYGDYWVLMLDEKYEYAVIGEPSREYFWILSRNKTLNEQTKEKILSKMPELGYEEKQLIWTTQTNK